MNSFVRRKRKLATTTVVQENKTTVEISANARQLAEDSGIVIDDLTPGGGTGKDGKYTVKDIERIIAAQEEE